MNMKIIHKLEENFNREKKDEIKRRNPPLKKKKSLAFQRMLM